MHRQLPLPQRRRCTTTDPRIIRGKPPTSEPAITHILSSARAARADEASQGLSERGWRWLGVSPEKPGNDLRQLTRECETPLIETLDNPAVLDRCRTKRLIDYTGKLDEEQRAHDLKRRL